MKSGKLIVRMDPKLHTKLAGDAKREGVSLNRFIVGMLERGAGFTPSAANGRRR